MTARSQSPALDNRAKLRYPDRKGGSAVNTIAVIEDDLPIGNLLEEVLTKAGYIVRRA